jgi:hypothetical protein
MSGDDGESELSSLSEGEGESVRGQGKDGQDEQEDQGG